MKIKRKVDGARSVDHSFQSYFVISLDGVPDFSALTYISCDIFEVLTIVTTDVTLL
jgi:hypothetical protein